jgi:hypothetical protein
LFINRPFTRIVAALLSVSSGSVWALDYPATPPGKAICALNDQQATLSNRVLHSQWRLAAGQITGLSVTNQQTEQSLRMETGHLPCIVLDDGQVIDLAALQPDTLVQQENNGILATFQHAVSGLDIRWSATLGDEDNAVIQALELNAARDTKIKELLFYDVTLQGAHQVGRVDGSVVVCGNIFLAMEHPLAKNLVNKQAHVRCALPRGNVLKAGRSWRYTSVIGVVPQGQLRRGFLYYLERRRAHSYWPFLHYNSWYHLNIGRPDNHMTEVECLATIEHFGRELIKTRGVKMDAFAWDDGWDEFNSLWEFHDDFPEGFKNLEKAGAQYGTAQGVWMSPWGGYGEPKEKRVAYGKAQGYETNLKGFSMAGPKYGAAYRDICLKMMREQGVIFFKFDGMGSVAGTGATGELASDIDAVLNLTSELRQENPDVFISATTGTWASPFWTLYADSIWRQGGDTGFHGPGNGRQQWITYRDKFCHQCIVQWGPMYPLNSLMLHGPCIGERTDPAKMDLDEKSVADEIWTFFGSGTNLQELYISPHLLTSTMWDELAAAAKWSRANSDILIDTHWIGGDPGNGDVYGWASWQPRGGIVVLRNPSDKRGTYKLELARALELPDRFLSDTQLQAVRPNQRIRTLFAPADEPLLIELQPFEVLVFATEAIVKVKKP